MTWPGDGIRIEWMNLRIDLFVRRVCSSALVDCLWEHWLTYYKECQNYFFSFDPDIVYIRM